jgi:hypothetical protein
MCFVCELPAKEIALTHVEVDSQIIADAAQRAQVIFSDGPPGGMARPRR